MKTFIPEKIYFEPGVLEYPLGKTLMERYQEKQIPMEPIENHNRIESLQKKSNKEFTTLKKYLILGTRKTHRYTENHKVSDYLVPYTSSGCTAMCLYCYLVCSYNKCAYLRLFVNREQMLGKLIKKAQSFEEEKVFEIGANSDLVLENTLTDNLPWTIENFTAQPKGKLTFPTKFHMVEPLLGLSHKKRVIVRMSLNPAMIIKKTEFGTSGLSERINAINQLCDSGYPVGILVAPIMFVDHWQELYTELFQFMAQNLGSCAKSSVFFEAIFMTYSFVQDKINQDAFPGAMEIYQKEAMTGRGRGKYWYKQPLRETGEQFFKELFHRYFPENELLYIV